MNSNHAPSDTLKFFPKIKSCFRAGDGSGYHRNINDVLNVASQIDWQEKENSSTSVLLIQYALPSHTPQLATYLLEQAVSGIQQEKNVFSRIYPYLNKAVFCNALLKEGGSAGVVPESLLSLEWDQLSVFQEALLNCGVTPKETDDPLGSIALSWLREEEGGSISQKMKNDLTEYMHWLYRIGANPIQPYQYFTQRHADRLDFNHPVLLLLREFNNEAEKGMILHEIEVGKLSRTTSKGDTSTPIVTKKM